MNLENLDNFKKQMQVEKTVYYTPEYLTYDFSYVLDPKDFTKQPRSKFPELNASVTPEHENFMSKMAITFAKEFPSRNNTRTISQKPIKQAMLVESFLFDKSNQGTVDLWVYFNKSDERHVVDITNLSNISYDFESSKFSLNKDVEYNDKVEAIMWPMSVTRELNPDNDPVDEKFEIYNKFHKEHPFINFYKYTFIRRLTIRFKNRLAEPAEIENSKWDFDIVAVERQKIGEIKYSIKLNKVTFFHPNEGKYVTMSSSDFTDNMKEIL